MNKTKKIAMSAVAAVMAGTMLFSFAGCKPNTPPGPGPSGGVNEKGLAVDADGKLSWNSDTSVYLNVGYNSLTSGVAFSATDDMPFTKGSETVTSPVLADGKTYEKGSMKPNMTAFASALDMKLVDRYSGKATNANLQDASQNFERYDLITANVADIVNEAVNGTLVNLGDYLDYMPNYKHYLQSNSLIQLSVIGDITNGSMYYTPYFDGVDDIERYVLFRHDYVTELLDHADLTADTKNGGSITYKQQADSKSYDANGTATQLTDASGTLLWTDKATGKLNVLKATKDLDGKDGTKIAKGEYYYVDNKENVKIAEADVAPVMSQGKYSATNRRNDVFNGESTVIESYMGKTGSWKVETANPKDETKVGYAKVNYDAVIAALENSDSDLYKAINASGVTTPQKASGNIVDIHNQMINATNGGVKGIDLLKVLREYVKIAYEYSDTENGTYTQLYGNTTLGTSLSDVFNSKYAAWDVDLWTAMSRCYVTCGNLLGTYQSGTHRSSLYGFVPRAEAGNRTSVTWAFIGELYGVRGLESRLGYTYIDASGNMRDARFNKSTWEAMDLYSRFQKEGLVGSYSNADTIGAATTSSSCSTNSFYDGKDSHLQALSAYDYVQTQTTLGYYLDGVDLAGSNTAKQAEKAYIEGKNNDTTKYIQTKDGYKWTAVLTPVSKWNVNDTSTKKPNGDVEYSKDSLSDNTTVMRFTESWRSVKSAGICVSKAAFDAGDAYHKSAVLGFIDYLYSNDGRIVNTYGNMASGDDYTKNGENYTSNCGGFWYGTPVTAAELGVTGDVNDMAAMKTAGVVETYDGKQYTITDAYAAKAFVFNNKLYKGFTYNGTQVPKITTACLAAFQGKTVNGYNIKADFVGSYTSFAQQILGTCLGFAEKMQSFECQMTATMGLEGESIVGSALGNGTIKHVNMAIDESNLWYTVAPTGLPLTNNATTAIKTYTNFDSLYKASSSTYNNLFLEVAAYGVAGANIKAFLANENKDLTSAEKIATVNKDYAPAFQQHYNTAWQELLDYYKTNIK